MAESGGNSTVQLGCGTLIVIAIIVAMFSGDRDSSRLRADVRDLKQQIEQLETKIERLSAKIDRLSQPKLPAEGEVRFK